MKRQIIYRFAQQRDNVIKIKLMNGFLKFSSGPRMLLEVFIRKSFGERYFNIPSAVGVFIFFACIPIVLYWPILDHNGRGEIQWSEMFKDCWLYFIYLIGFLIACYFRYKEVKREPSIFELGKYSLSHGKIHPKFREIKYKGQLVTTRQIETVCEPLFCFVFGVILYFINYPAGLLVMICAIFYSFSYVALYIDGDYQIMDYLDSILINEHFLSMDLPDGSPGSSSDSSDAPYDPPPTDGPDDKGFDPSWKVPDDPTLRRRIYDRMFNEDIPDVR